MMNSKSHSKPRPITIHQPWSRLVEQIQAWAESSAIFAASLQNRLQIRMSCVLEIKTLIPVNYQKVFCIRVAFNRASLQACRIMETRLVSRQSTERFCMMKATPRIRSYFADVSVSLQRESIAKVRRLVIRLLCLEEEQDAMAYAARPSPP